MIRVLVAGAAGRMGREVVRAVSAEEDMVVVAAVDPGANGVSIEDGAGGSVACTTDLASALEATSPDVVVDFTRPDVVAQNVSVATASGVDCVIGTTGVDPQSLGASLESAPDGTSIFVAPNFAIGAVLLMRFAQEAASHLPHVEIIELHHDRKLDAPSGTAMRTAELVAAARRIAPAVPGSETEVVAGARGSEVDGIHVHSVRLPGLVAHQEVIFGGQGQTLTIRHDSLDRTSFMPGVILAVRASSGLSGLVVGLESLLED